MGDSNARLGTEIAHYALEGAQAKSDGVRTRRGSLHQIADILLGSVQLPVVLFALRTMRCASFVCVVGVLRRTVVHALARPLRSDVITRMSTSPS